MHDETLRRCLLFYDLDDLQFRVVAGLVEEVSCRIGETVFREGDEGDAFYIIASGAIKITKSMPDGHELVVAQLGEGEIFGEMSLVSATPRSSSCVFTQNGLLWKLSRERYEGLQQTNLPVYASVLQNIAALLCDRLGTMTAEVAALLDELARAEQDSASLEEQLTKGKTGLMGFLKSLGGSGHTAAP